MNRGNSKQHLGRHEEAVADFDRTIELESNWAEAYHHRGLSKSALGREDEAVADFDRAIELNPDLEPD